MFLKRIEAIGFKSFADKTNILFDYNVTGIVGPNGCGKSNISDAIRWVLGEQSPKQLRGNNMADVIFNGSASRKPLNKAEVTLVFDNTNRVFPIEYNEVEISRVLYRSGESEYFLNKEHCRLKDITNLIMDTGLGRDSLSIISQDKIQDFAKARPEERRAVFEEAAGVAKYKKRKLESTSKLEKTQDNLDRLEPVINEIESRLRPLKNQKDKAEKYNALRQDLEKIEVSVIVDDIKVTQNEIENLAKSLDDYSDTRSQKEARMAMYDAKIEEMRQDQAVIGREITNLHREYAQVLEEISQIESRKAIIEEKRKAWLESHVEMSPERIQMMQGQCEEARIEYEDRLNRLNGFKHSEMELQNKLPSLKEMKQKADDEVSNIQYKISRLEQRKAVLDNQIKSPLQAQQGVKSVMDARRSLPGIEGVIVELVKPEGGYENAISNALGGSLYNVLATDTQAATKAIEYLKRNEGGRATFLPLTSLQIRPISKEAEVIAQNVKGYLGLAKDHVSIESKYQNVVDYLLGQIMVCETLDAANEVARLIKYSYRVVTLDGDIINKGGSMTGGKVKNQSSALSYRKELEDVEQQLQYLQQELETWTSQQRAIDRDINTVNDSIQATRIDLARIEPILQAKKAKYEKLRDELNEVGANEARKEEIDDPQDNSIVVELNGAHQRKDQISLQLQNLQTKDASLRSEIDRLDESSRLLQKETRSQQSEEMEVTKKKNRLEVTLDNLLDRLGQEYQMTAETAFAQASAIENIVEAKQQVYLLRQQISSLGNINQDAPQEYEEQNARYIELTTARDELLCAKNQILDVIKEMDEVMSKDFITTFNAINDELQDVFSSLFGGGYARLNLVDPDDILETGIEIDVQPPGKAVKSMSLFSGGEKSLIALAVLFSIMRCRRVPLCILDECESALDPANVERFSRFLKRFKETQFIVVTHRPGTMEQCDYLYGVTMQDRGVTQMLHVKLSEALQLDSNKEGA